MERGEVRLVREQGDLDDLDDREAIWPSATYL